MRKNKLKVQRGTKALEMIMRDVIDSMEDASNAMQFQCATQTIQILSIEVPENSTTTEPAQITNIYSITNPPPLHRSKDVVSYLLEREERQNPLLSA